MIEEKIGGRRSTLSILLTHFVISENVSETLASSKCVVFRCVIICSNYAVIIILMIPFMKLMPVMIDSPRPCVSGRVRSPRLPCSDSCLAMIKMMMPVIMMMTMITMMTMMTIKLLMIILVTNTVTCLSTLLSILISGCGSKRPFRSPQHHLAYRYFHLPF